MDKIRSGTLSSVESLSPPLALGRHKRGCIKGGVSPQIAQTTKLAKYVRPWPNLREIGQRVGEIKGGVSPTTGQICAKLAKFARNRPNSLRPPLLRPPLFPSDARDIVVPLACRLGRFQARTFSNRSGRLRIFFGPVETSIDHLRSFHVASDVVGDG